MQATHTTVLSRNPAMITYLLAVGDSVDALEMLIIISGVTKSKTLPLAQLYP